MSQTLLQRPTPTPNPPQREVIDVDDLNLSGETSQRARTRPFQHGRRPQEPIVIDDDSDDEVEIISAPTHMAAPAAVPIHRVRRPHVVRNILNMPRRSMLFSPSPPPPDNYIPPVPPLPRHFRDEPAHGYRYTRDFSDVIHRPFPTTDDPHPIRNEPREPRNTAAGGPGPAANAAARRNNMALGGALLSMNVHGPPAPPAPRAHAGGWRYPLELDIAGFGLHAYRALIRNTFGSPEVHNNDPVDDPDLLEALALSAEERQQTFRQRLFDNPARQQKAESSSASVYAPTFTHPSKPEAGFTHNFTSQEVITLSDEPGPSSASAETSTGTSLACAHCRDPLVMNVAGSEEEAKRRKLFALRCGHILDGKCVEELMKPAPPPPILEREDEAIASSSGKGKGKGKGKASQPEPLEAAGSSPSLLERLDSALPPKLDKGKQRAIAPEQDASVASGSSPNKPKASPHEGLNTDSGWGGPISSRTRRHAPSLLPPQQPFLPGPWYVDPTGTPATEGLLPNIDTASPQRSARSGPARRARGRGRVSGRGRGRGKGKGKGKAGAPVVEAEYEWMCPVASCGHKHLSICIEGVWRMDEARGAIPMFV